MPTPRSDLENDLRDAALRAAAGARLVGEAGDARAMAAATMDALMLTMGAMLARVSGPVPASLDAVRARWPA